MSQTLQTALLIYIAALLSLEALGLQYLLPVLVVVAFFGLPVVVFVRFANDERPTE
ncbi:hypothetical protein [Haloprofundus marisrubri]|uniref:hypothetical protein n=1 Tax=Haloprofundus marisrubri TaxID=1514971 RepID=UPI0012BA5769|nr:hypothetical protein [Haloprofundus marisrubri]